jgi:hypothetical protein
MATSEILGLFQTPDQYAAAQDAALQRQFVQRATLDPFQKASVLAQQAGYSAAQGIGGALGGKDPQLEMISRRNVLLSQLNPSDPSSYIKAAEVAAKMGDSQFAVLIAQEGRKAQSEIALTAQRNAAANKETQQALPPAIQISQTIANLKIGIARLEAMPESAERNETLDRLKFNLEELQRQGGGKQPEFLAKEARLQELKAALRIQKNQPEPNKEAIQRLEDSIQAIEGVPKEPSVGSSAEVVSKELYFKPFAELTQDQVAKVNAEVAKRKKEEIKAGVTPAQQQQKLVAKNKSDLAAQVETDAYNSADRVTLAKNLKSLLPTAFTGVDANLKLQASRVAEVFGINIQGVPDSQIIDTILGEMTIGAASKLKGGLSDKDVKFLKETIGTRGLSLRTLQFVADKIEQDALIDGQLNDVVNKYVAEGGDLNTFNFASKRKEVSEKVKKDLARIKELREKAKSQ